MHASILRQMRDGSDSLGSGDAGGLPVSQPGGSDDERWARTADWDLVRAYVAGDAAAFVALTRRHSGLPRHLFGRRARHLRGYTDAEEVANETWYQALRQIHAGNVPWGRSCSSWLGGLCLNVLRERSFRRESPGEANRPRTAAAEVADDDEPLPDDLVAEAELHAATRDCLASLPGRLRVVFEEIYAKDGTNVAAASALGCTEANVRLKLRPRLVHLVARCLADKGFRVADLGEGGSNR
jgi:DNA-directed RNA polymerase specialized sigma24 family protein